MFISYLCLKPENTKFNNAKHSFAIHPTEDLHAPKKDSVLEKKGGGKG